MADDATDPYADFKTRIDAFARALERLIVVARLLVTVQDDVLMGGDGGGRRYRMFSVPYLGPLTRRLFMESDEAVFRLDTPWSGAASSPPVPSQFMGVAAGATLYLEALHGPRFRWDLRVGRFENEAGETWHAWVYPPTFPQLYSTSEDTLRPDELGMLEGALALLKMPALGDETAPNIEIKPSEEFGSVKLYGKDAAPIVANKEKPLLTPAQYEALRALIEACKVRVGNAKPRPSGSDIQAKYGRTSAPSPSDIGKRLKEINAIDTDWGAAIDLPGVPGGGYFIN